MFKNMCKTFTVVYIFMWKCTGCPVKLFTPVFKSKLCLSCKSDPQMEYLLFSWIKIEVNNGITHKNSFRNS